MHYQHKEARHHRHSIRSPAAEETGHVVTATDNKTLIDPSTIEATKPSSASREYSISSVSLSVPAREPFMSALQHQSISELCDQVRLDRITSEWLALSQKVVDDTASLGNFLEQLLRFQAGGRGELRGRCCFAFLAYRQ